MKSIILTIALAITLTSGLPASADESRTGRYLIIQAGRDGRGTWQVDTVTGDVRLCIVRLKARLEPPLCTPPAVWRQEDLAAYGPIAEGPFLPAGQ